MDKLGVRGSEDREREMERKIGTKMEGDGEDYGESHIVRNFLFL